MSSPLRIPGPAALAIPLLLTGAPGLLAAQDHLASLVRAERAFARSSGDHGVSAAFLEVLAEDGVVFSPGPVSGRELHSTNPWPEAYVLEWHPRVAAVSSAGDLGYTSGPYTFRSSPEAETASYGHYFSVWRRPEPDGTWELVLDIGTPHPRLEDQDHVPEVREFPEVEEAPESWSREEAVRELREASRRVRGAMDGTGAGDEVSRTALAELTLDGVRVYRTAMVPAVGREGLAGRVGTASAEDGDRSRRWTVRDAWVGGGLDLGVVWGGWEVAGEGAMAGGARRPERGSWVEVWVVRGGGWRLAAVVMHGWGGSG